MKFLHLSDLHLGKRVNEFSMIEDQRYVLGEILKIADEQKPDGVIIAGDVYDKTVPTAEAVSLLDDFLVQLEKRGQPVFIISGNHDSSERLSFARSLIGRSGIHISPVYDGNVVSYTLEDEYGEVTVYLLPFIKPVHVRSAFPDEERDSYSDALSIAVKHMGIDKSKRNILVTHQFVTGAERSESEDVVVGGLDNVDVSVFEDFDYVALGHIHGPQNMVKNKVRYCGTMLKYSFSECNHKKSVTIVEMGDKGSVNISEVYLKPLHDMVQIRGSYDELMNKNYYQGTTLTSDYVHVILTDENDIPDAINRLRTVYANIMKLTYDNARTKNNASVGELADAELKSPIELVGELYEQQNGTSMTEEQRQFMETLIERIWGDRN